MLDRASSLRDPDVLRLLGTRFVPVAVDQHVHRHLKDDEGKLFASVLKQAGRGLGGTSQGNYLFSPEGKLLAFANTADAGHVKRLMDSALRKMDPDAGKAVTTPESKAPTLFEPPEGGLVVAVTARVLGGYEKGGSTSKAVQEALGRDHLWVRRDEADALTRGELLPSLQERIARYHLIDNTRGEPPMWRADEVRKLEMTLRDGRLTGTVHLETRSGSRGYEAKVLGHVEAKGGKVTRLDVVFLGEFWGEGTYTRGAPPGRFPFAVALTLSPGTSAADRVPPGGARGNLQAYLR